jgi:hypothetical protein
MLSRNLSWQEAQNRIELKLDVEVGKRLRKRERWHYSMRWRETMLVKLNRLIAQVLRVQMLTSLLKDSCAYSDFMAKSDR